MRIFNSSLILSPSKGDDTGTVPQSFRAQVTHAYDPQDWQPRPDQATVFQQAGWLTPLYGAIARHAPAVTPLFMELRDEAGALAFRLPLLLRKSGGMRVIEFADLNMSDFNAPLLGPASPLSPGAAQKAWGTLRQALPPHDLLRLIKMPGEIGGKPNPLLLGRRPMLAGCNGNLLALGESWNDYHFSLEKTVRKELERSWRVFSREQGILKHFTDPAEALALLPAMEEAQRTRMENLGQPYHMEQPVTAAVHRALMSEGVASGFACLTALIADGKLVSALLGLRDGETYVMTRLVHASGPWSKVSPGRLLVHKTMEMLHGQGYRCIDFSIGNYAYKRRFGPTRVPLYDLGVPATLLGMPGLLRMHAGAALRRHPQARETVRRLLGKPSLREEN